MKGYRSLKIYQQGHELALKVHSMTMDLPRFEMYEEGSQIRRSSKSVTNLIVEGYSLRVYKQQYVNYLWRAYASSEETIEHLDYLFETGSWTDKTLHEEIKEGYQGESKMIFSFIRSVESEHDTDLLSLRENERDYGGE